MMESSPDRCTWVGHRLDVRPLYHAADVAVVPSRWGEPFGRAVLEPMSSGIPVLGSIDGGIPETLTGRFGEFLVAPDDPAALAEKLARVRGWREREPDLGTACRNHVVRNFSLEREIDGVEGLFSDVLATAGGRDQG
jgi:glycosyltransferase involved in cell wall biosynthesis